MKVHLQRRLDFGPRLCPYFFSTWWLPCAVHTPDRVWLKMVEPS